MNPIPAGSQRFQISGEDGLVIRAGFDPSGIAVVLFCGSGGIVAWLLNPRLLVL